MTENDDPTDVIGMPSDSKYTAKTYEDGNGFLNVAICDTVWPTAAVATIWGMVVGLVPLPRQRYTYSPTSG